MDFSVIHKAICPQCQGRDVFCHRCGGDGTVDVQPKKLDIEQFIRELPWSNDATEIQKLLVAGNLRNLYWTLARLYGFDNDNT